MLSERGIQSVLDRSCRSEPGWQARSGIGRQLQCLQHGISGQNIWGDAVVYTGNGDGTFTLDDGPWVGGVDNSGIALGDFNRDGMIDMAVAGNAGWTSQNWVTINQNNTQPVSVSPLALAFKAQTVGTKSPTQTAWLRTMKRRRSQSRKLRSAERTLATSS